MSVQRYSVSMIFSDVDDGIKIDGTVEFEMEIKIPSNKDDLELLAEESAFLRIENSDTDFGKGSLPNLEIDTMDKIENVDLEILKNALASIEECYKCGCEKPQNDLSFVDDQYYCENCL